MNSLQPQTPFNASKYPVVDRHGTPFTPGCRVRFTLQSYYINTFGDEGVLCSNIDAYGGFTIHARKQWPVRDRNGAYNIVRHEVYASVARYTKGRFVTAGKLDEQDVFVDVIP